MTKRDLVVRIAQKTGYKQQDVMMVLQEVLELIVEQVASGQGLEFRNFGVFDLVVRKSRVGRNPNAPKNTVTIPERVVVKFKPGKIMRERVQQVQPCDIRPVQRDKD